MRKIPTHELAGYLAGHTSHHHSPLIRGLEELAVDEDLVVKKSEGPGKTDFRSYICSVANRRGRKYTTRTLADGSGWAVLRLK
jgi:hypothetical protein